MNVTILGSGSNGNALVFDFGGANILVDCGFGTRTLAHRLKLAKIAPESIEALVITHEHSDHCSGAAAASRKWRWPVYATAGTLAGTRSLRGSRMQVIDPNGSLSLTHATLSFCRTPHDAAQSVALVATSKASGARVGVAYDLGHVPSSLPSRFHELDVLILESNYDDVMLRNGPYPPFLQARIAGRLGHLNNRHAGEMARACVHRGLRHLVLAHLSEHNNTPALALKCAAAALARTSFRGRITAASQTEILTIPIEAPRGANQFALGL